MEIDKLPLTDPNFDPTSLPGIGPALASVSSGEAPGFWAPRAALAKDPTMEPLRQNARALVSKLGIGIYAGKNDRIVLYNPEVLKTEEVKKIDAAGALEKVFQPLPVGGGEAPVPAPEEQPAPAAPGAASLVPPASPSAAANNSQRLTQSKPKKPSDTAIPGGGSILNGLLKRPA